MEYYLSRLAYPVFPLGDSDNRTNPPRASERFIVYHTGHYTRVLPALRANGAWVNEATYLRRGERTSYAGVRFPMAALQCPSGRGVFDTEGGRGPGFPSVSDPLSPA